MKPRHTALIALVILIWSVTAITAKIAIDAVPPVLFTGLRFVLVAAVLLPWLRVLPGRMRPIVTVAIFGGCLHFALMYTGMAMADSVSAVMVLVQLGAPFSVLLAVLLLKERLGMRRGVGIGVAVAGVLVLGFDPVVFTQPAAGLMVIAAAAFMGFATIEMRRLQGVSMLQLQAWISVLSAPPLLVLSLLLEDGQAQAIAGMSWTTVGALAFTALATSIVAHGSWFYLLQRYPISQLTGFGLIPPILSVMLGIVVLGEPATWKLALSALLVTLGVGLTTLPARARRPAVPHDPAAVGLADRPGPAAPPAAAGRANDVHRAVPSKAA